MKLNERMRTSMRANAANLLNAKYCSTTDEMYEKMRKAISDELAERDDFKERVNLLKEYPCYVTPDNRVDVVIFPKEEISHKMTIRLDFKFAQKHYTNTLGGYNIDWPSVSELELSEETGEHIRAYTRRLEDNHLMLKRIDDVYSRVTTLKQLLMEIPALGIFFDEDGDFFVPDFGD